MNEHEAVAVTSVPDTLPATVIAATVDIPPKPKSKIRDGRRDLKTINARLTTEELRAVAKRMAELYFTDPAKTEAEHLMMAVDQVLPECRPEMHTLPVAILPFKSEALTHAVSLHLIHLAKRNPEFFARL